MVGVMGLRSQSRALNAEFVGVAEKIAGGCWCVESFEKIRGQWKKGPWV
jgi:hypothetical protein